MSAIFLTRLAIAPLLFILHYVQKPYSLVIFIVLFVISRFVEWKIPHDTANKLHKTILRLCNTSMLAGLMISDWVFPRTSIIAATYVIVFGYMLSDLFAAFCRTIDFNSSKYYRATYIVLDCFHVLMVLMLYKYFTSWNVPVGILVFSAMSFSVVDTVLRSYLGKYAFMIIYVCAIIEIMLNFSITFEWQ